MKVREGMPVIPKPYRGRGPGRGQLTMAKFFINRPIVAMVISILMVIAGVVSMLSLPTAQFPNIADPQIQVLASYTGADARTVAQSVATPIEQQMSGVDGMNYMYSLNSSNGADDSDGGLRHRHRGQHRPDPGADAHLAGQLAAAQRRDQQRHHRTEIDFGADDADRPVLAQRHLRQHLSGQLRHHQSQ